MSSTLNPEKSRHAEQSTALEARSRSMLRSRLGRVESQELFRRWQQDRDQAVRDELFQRFSPLARKLARRSMGALAPDEDLLQVASYGLLRAVDRYDPDRGTTFSTFAVPTILGELKRYFRDLGWPVHVPRKTQELALKVQQANENLMTRTGRSPTAQELAQYMKVSIKEALEGLEAAVAHRATSLQTPVENDDGDAVILVDTLGVEDEGFALVEEATSFATAMQQLPQRERRILELRFHHDLSQSEIARSVGGSRMQISRTLRRTLKQLNELTRQEAQ